MIPKIIHYCWFGHNPLPPLALKCIESWEKFLPDYEIKRWDENNFDISIVPYVNEAYEAKKYAFVSDYARFWILFNYGGVYFDTDVEILKDISHIIHKGPFMGFEQPFRLKEATREHKGFPVNPGLGLGAVAGMKLYKEILDYYSMLRFINKDGSYNETTVVENTTKILEHHGLITNNELQCVDGIWIYPYDVMCPKNSFTGKAQITENTVCIHYFDGSWLSKSFRRKQKIINIIGLPMTDIILTLKGVLRKIGVVK